MREILFRGKRTDNGEWVEGSLIVLDADSGYYFITESYESASTLPVKDLIYNHTHLVDPETVCQFTGLTDKNGVKIFEGDVVSTDIKRPYFIIEFRDGCFMCNCNDGGDDYYDIMLPIHKEPHENYEYGAVIGNIFDNPELMEGGGSDDCD